MAASCGTDSDKNYLMLDYAMNSEAMEKKEKQLAAYHGKCSRSTVRRSDVHVTPLDGIRLTLDEHPVTKLCLHNLPMKTKAPALKEYLVKEHEVEVLKLEIAHIPNSGKPPFGKVIVSGPNEAAKLQFLAKKELLIFKGRMIRVDVSYKQPAPIIKEDISTIHYEELKADAQIRTLTAHAWAMIFSLLPIRDLLSCYKVCGLWRRIMCEFAVMKTFDISTLGELSHEDLLTLAKIYNSDNRGFKRVLFAGSEAKNFLRPAITKFIGLLNADHLTTLDMSGVFLNTSAMTHISANFEHLDTLKIGDYALKDECFLKVIIRENDLKNFGIYNNGTTGKFLDELAGCKCLTSFTMSMCSRIRYVHVEKFLKSSPSLSHLAIRRCPGVTRYVPQTLGKNNQIMKKMKYLHLEGTTLYESDSHATGRSNQIGNHLSMNVLSNLRRLTLTNLNWIGSSVISTIGKTDITHLDLSGCETQRGWWSRLSEGSGKLQYLAINGLVRFFESTPPVEDWDNEVPRREEDMDEYIAVEETFKDFAKLKDQLKHLELRNYTLKKLPRGIIDFLSMNDTLREFDIRQWKNLKEFQFVYDLNCWRQGMYPLKIHADKIPNWIYKRRVRITLNVSTRCAND